MCSPHPKSTAATTCARPSLRDAAAVVACGVPPQPLTPRPNAELPPGPLGLQDASWSSWLIDYTPPKHPYPGPDFTHPKIRQSPDCLHHGGWHDMAGALTFNGVHHAFQGCPADGGWSHSSSTDLVHWTDRGRGVHVLHETYEGMDSSDEPCSGFVTVDDAGTPLRRL